MGYNEAYKKVLSQVSDVVNEMYEKYRKNEKLGLEKETDTESQLEILANKKIISRTYISDLSLIAEYYVRDMTPIYYSKLLEYEMRMRSQIESIPY